MASIRLLLINAIDLAQFSGQEISIPLLRDLVISAPQSLDEVQSEAWRAASATWKAMSMAAARKDKMTEDEIADLSETVTYFTKEFLEISFKTRSIIKVSFTNLTRPLTTRPLRKLFCSGTKITPEAAFEGKIIIVDLPLQELDQVGKIAAMIWKFCFQRAVLQRKAVPGQNLPVAFLYADEFQNFITGRDAMYQSVSRSAGACSIYLTQNLESLRMVLGSDDRVKSLTANLQCVLACANSGESNEWMARLFGERWTEISHSGISYSESGGGGHRETAEQRRYYVEPIRFTTLKRGGRANNYEVEAIAYNGGAVFAERDPATGRTEHVPYRLLTFKQGGS